MDKVSLRSSISTPADTTPVPWFVHLSHLGSLLPYPRSIPAGTGVTDAWPASSADPHPERKRERMRERERERERDHPSPRAMAQKEALGGKKGTRAG